MRNRTNRGKSRIARVISLALGAASLAAVDGCNAISGVEDFAFEDVPTDASVQEGAAGSEGKDAAKESDSHEAAVEDAADAGDSAQDANDAADGNEEASVDADAAPVDAPEDAADAQDAPSDTPDAQDAADALADVTADSPDGTTPDAPFDAPWDVVEAASGCTSNTDCAGDAGTPYCDKPSGKCVECLTATDPCPQGEFCSAATLTCEIGCKNDGDCTGGAKCNVAAHQCVVAGIEVCAGGVDEDNDGRIDCFDTDCASSPVCSGFCTEPEPETVACGAVVTGKNSGGAGSTQRLAPPPYSCSAGSYPGPERAFKITGAAGQNVFAEIYGLGADLAVFAVNPPTGGQCNATASCAAFGDLLTTSNAEALGIAADAGKDYYVIVDGPAAADFSLSVQCAPATGCFPARAIQAGQSITTSNATGSENVTSKVSHHAPFATSGWLAPEAAFIFTPTTSGSYTIGIKGLNGGGQFDCDLDMFLKASTACGDDSIASGATTGQKAESIIFEGVANTSYFIVVDGYATDGVPCISQFTLSVTGP